MCVVSKSLALRQNYEVDNKVNKCKVTSITVCRKDSVRIKDKWASLVGDKNLVERKVDTLKKCNCIGKNPYLMILEESESLDVNDVIDLKIANILLTESENK